MQFSMESLVDLAFRSRNNKLNIKCIYLTIVDNIYFFDVYTTF